MSATIRPVTPLDNAIQAWVNASTDATSSRFNDLVRDKTRAVTNFFAFSGVSPELATAQDIKAWQGELEQQGKSPATIYAMVSRVSAFYDFLLSDQALAGFIRSNPVKMARPKAPKPCQSEKTKALDDEQVQALGDYIKAKADAGELVGMLILPCSCSTS